MVNYLITDNLALQTDCLVSNELSMADHTGYTPLVFVHLKKNLIPKRQFYKNIEFRGYLNLTVEDL